MTSRTMLLGALVLATLHAPAALAQAPAETGTGGDAASTVRAPNTSSVGQTVPRAGAVGPEADRNLDRRTPQQTKDDQITKGICVGCDK